MQFTYQGRGFYLNGEKFTARSGSMDYFRTPKFYWEDRLLKLKEARLQGGKVIEINR